VSLSVDTFAPCAPPRPPLTSPSPRPHLNRYTEQLTAGKIIELLEGHKSYHGLYFYLGSYIAFSEDAEVRVCLCAGAGGGRGGGGTDVGGR
jgi:hypothetical protein